MAKVTNVAVKPFVLPELARLKQELHVAGTKASGGEIVGALVFAARRSPVEAVQAVIQTYWVAEAALDRIDDATTDDQESAEAAPATEE